MTYLHRGATTRPFPVPRRAVRIHRHTVLGPSASHDRAHRSSSTPETRASAVECCSEEF
jgi:hypothetical protein